jgi:hypothetical protein
MFHCVQIHSFFRFRKNDFSADFSSSENLHLKLFMIVNGSGVTVGTLHEKGEILKMFWRGAVVIASFSVTKDRGFKFLSG